MSTYQYYEFLALDGPISDEGLTYARGCSSRADVSRYRWTNSYHWGDFSGNEDTLLNYYDAFYYFADWGSFRFSLSLPEECLPKSLIESYLVNDEYDFGAYCRCHSNAGGRMILSWECQEEAGCWDFPEDLDDLLGRLAGIREQILRGDYRALFIGWLARFDPEWVDDEEVLLPPVPSGMNALTDGLRLLAEQMQMDEDVLQAAVQLSSDGSQAKPLPIHNVLDALPVEAMKSLLVRVSEGEGDKVKAELIRRTLPPDEYVLGATGLTCGEFSKQVIRVRDERMRVQERDKETKRLQLEEEQRKHLERVYEQSEAIWTMLDQLLVNKTPSAYDTAAKQLKELRDAYFQQDDLGEFLERMSLFRGRYGRRPALIRRLDELADFM